MSKHSDELVVDFGEHRARFVTLALLRGYVPVFQKIFFWRPALQFVSREFLHAAPRAQISESSMICGNQRRIVNNCRPLSRGTNRGRDEHIYRDVRELCFRSTDDAGIEKRDEFSKPRPRPHRAEPLSGFTAARSVISKSGDPFPRFRIRSKKPGCTDPTDS